MNHERYNIVLLGPCYPYRGGIASFTERLAKEFNTAGHQTLLCTFKLQYPSFLFPGKTQFSEAPPPEYLNIKRWVNTINPFNWILVGRTIKKLKPDLIIVRYWMPFLAPSMGTILKIAKSNKHTKIICISDNIVPHEKRTGDKLLTSYFIKFIDSFVVMSQTVMADLKNLGVKKPIQLLSHPLFDHYGTLLDQKIARQELLLPQDRPLLLFFGLIRAYKGLDLLIHAMSDERVKKTRATLLVAGEFYENKDKYLNLVKEMNLEGSIIFHDEFIPEDKVQFYFSAADVLVQPYKTATQSGVTPLAMHFNLPMVVTNAGGLKEMVVEGETGFVTAINAESLAEGIICFLHEGKESYVTQIEKRKSHYSWNGFMHSLLQDYKMLDSNT
jgi:glycosyltransferase involved in cell wall biosynthesis